MACPRDRRSGIDASAGQELGATNDCPGLSWGVLNHHDWRPPLFDWANACCNCSSSSCCCCFFFLCVFWVYKERLQLFGVHVYPALVWGAHQLVSRWIDWILALCTVLLDRWYTAKTNKAGVRARIDATTCRQPISTQSLAHAFSGNPPLFYALVSSINQLISLSKFEIQLIISQNQSGYQYSIRFSSADRPAQHDH